MYLEYCTEECQEGIYVCLGTLFLGSIRINGIKDDPGGYI